MFNQAITQIVRRINKYPNYIGSFFVLRPEAREPILRRMFGEEINDSLRFMENGQLPGVIFSEEERVAFSEIIKGSRLFRHGTLSDFRSVFEKMHSFCAYKDSRTHSSRITFFDICVDLFLQLPQWEKATQEEKRPFFNISLEGFQKVKAVTLPGKNFEEDWEIVRKAHYPTTALETILSQYPQEFRDLGWSFLTKMITWAYPETAELVVIILLDEMPEDQLEQCDTDVQRWLWEADYSDSVMRAYQARLDREGS